MLIKKATEKDALLIYNLAQKELGRSPSLDRLKEIFTTSFGFLLFDSQKLVGFIYGTKVAPDIIEISNLFIDKDYRNLGHGSELMKTFEAEAKKSYRHVLVITSTLWPNKDISSSRFYDQLEYKLVFQSQGTDLLIKGLST